MNRIILVLLSTIAAVVILTTTTINLTKEQENQQDYDFVLINGKRYDIFKFLSLRTFQDTGYNVWFHVRDNLIRTDKNIRPNDKIFNPENEQIGMVPTIKNYLSKKTFIPVSINETASIYCGNYGTRLFENKRIYLENMLTDLWNIFNIFPNSSEISTCKISYM